MPLSFLLTWLLLIVKLLLKVFTAATFNKSLVSNG